MSNKIKPPTIGPFVYWRSGRPRFVPGRKERALGFQGEDLRHADGRWMNLDEARGWCEARYAEILERRADDKPRKQPPTPPRAATVAALVEDFLAAMTRGEPGPEGRPLKSATLSSYRKAAAALLYRPESHSEAVERRAQERAALQFGSVRPARALEPFARVNVKDVGAPELKVLFLALKRERGHHMAHQALALYSTAHLWGMSSPHWRLGANPRHALKLERPEPRVVIYTVGEIRALVAAADAHGRASIGDAIMLGLFTGQRQGDRLALCDDGLHAGRRQFRQHKTGAIVAVPETPALADRLTAARKRGAAIKMQFGSRDAELVLDETTGRPYRADTYRHVFGQVRALAIAGSIAHTLAPCPSLAGKRDQDLRDTAVTWLANAGCTLPEIAAITGHSLQSIHHVLKHYLAITPELADAAIAKLVAWMEREGMAV